MFRSLVWFLALSTALAACGTDDFDGDGVSAEDGDCDDLNPNALPGGVEVCDGADNDCNGEIDDGASDVATFYADADGDYHGDPDASVQACEAPAGHVAQAGDCDDADPGVHEDAVEICNGKDDNCDSAIDDGAAAPATYYRDSDGDRWGDAGDSVEACAQPTGYVDAAGDCDDTRETSFPGAVEVCNGFDDDCDEGVDLGAVDMVSWYEDVDGDNYGAGAPVQSCDAPAAGWQLNNTDCNDSLRAINPAATEICDGVDNDCDGRSDVDATDALDFYRDADGDGYGDGDWLTYSCDQPFGYTGNDADCDDVDGTSYPGGTEVCDDADNDCDGVADDSPVDIETWYLDSDGDGAGDADSTVESCDQPSGYVENDLDCDDADRGTISGCFAREGVTMTNCSATGQNGPTQAACDTKYAGTDLEDQVVVTRGIQTLTVPSSGTFLITAAGAQGTSADTDWVGGKGAVMSGEFTLSKGDTLTVVVGQIGVSDGCNGGGGGGTFVLDGSTALVVAGGGGGNRDVTDQNGCGGRTTTYGGLGSGSSSTSSCAVKTSGLTTGGIVSSSSWGSGGAGLSGNGTGEYSTASGGQSPANGATGGGDTTYTAYGGFGGGGAGNGSCGGGGGGGYSGGDGGRVAGGGGSYNSGSSQVNTADSNSGMGWVLIEAI